MRGGVHSENVNDLSPRTGVWSVTLCWCFIETKLYFPRAPLLVCGCRCVQYRLFNWTQSHAPLRGGVHSENVNDLSPRTGVWSVTLCLCFIETKLYFPRAPLLVCGCRCVQYRLFNWTQSHAPLRGGVHSENVNDLSPRTGVWSVTLCWCFIETRIYFPRAPLLVCGCRCVQYRLFNWTQSHAPLRGGGTLGKCERSLSAHWCLVCDSLLVFYRNKTLFSVGAAARLRLSLRSIQIIQLDSVARAVARGGTL